jgi:hypothetical protein
MTTTADRLHVVEGVIAQTAGKLVDLTERRNAALMKDADTEAAKLGAEIEHLQRLAEGHRDKLVLLKRALAEEENERRAKERAALIGKIEDKIEERDKVMFEMADAIKQLANTSERAFKIIREIASSWSWAPHDLTAALLTPPAIMAAVSHEFYRTSYHPRRYGGQDTDPLAGIMLPGARCPRLEWMEQPQRTRSLADVTRDASVFAREYLRTGKSSSAVEAASVPLMNGGERVRTEAEQRLSDLLLQQAKLAEDVTPAGERAYALIVREIERAQAAISAEKQVEQQGHAGS